MKEYSVRITIAKDGSINAKTHGVQGEACVELMDSVLAQVEGKQEGEYTDDYYQETSTQQTVNIGGKH